MQHAVSEAVTADVVEKEMPASGVYVPVKDILLA